MYIDYIKSNENVVVIWLDDTAMIRISCLRRGQE